MFLDLGPWILSNAIVDQEQRQQGLQAEGAQEGPVLVGTFFNTWERSASRQRPAQGRAPVRSWSTYRRDKVHLMEGRR